MDELRRSLLRALFEAEKSGEVDAIKFRAAHHAHRNVLDELENGYIERDQKLYRLRLAAYGEIAEEVSEVSDLLVVCESIFQELHRYYLEAPTQSISVQDLAKRVGIEEGEVRKGLQIVVKASIFGSRTTDINDKAAIVAPSESILDHNSFSDIIKQHQKWCKEKPTHLAVEMPFLRANKVNIDSIDSLLHPEIKKHALGQFIDGHLRNAVLDSVIAIFDLIRQRTGLEEDGDALVGKVFSLTDPYLILSEIKTDSGQNDQKGFMQIFKGVYQGIRNPKAHSLTHDLTKEKAAQYLVLSSLLARRVEEATLVKVKADIATGAPG